MQSDWAKSFVWKRVEGYPNTPEPRFPSKRASIIFLLCAGSVWLLGAGTLLVFGREPPKEGRLQRDNSAGISSRSVVAGLTLAERVAYQRAIEDVYWRHRISPKGRPDPKLSFDAVMTRPQLETKVKDYLGQSQLAASQSGSPISAIELQAEMERMASQTKQPGVLRELFAALGNDPFVVAECLARPILAERLVRKTIGAEPMLFQASLRNPPKATTYTLPEILGTDSCVDNSWTDTTTANASEARDGHTAIWTGSEMIVWGGENASGNFLNTGARYNPATDNWIAVSTTNAPTVRWHHTAVWTGTEMIVWGGGGNGIVNTGGKYNPLTNSWTATSSTDAPLARIFHTAIWSGAEMIVWGGYNQSDGRFNSGGRYNPSTDTWTATNIANAPSKRWAHTAVWTGTEMIVWGGTDPGVNNHLQTGGRYNPATNSWLPTPLTNVPAGCVFHTAVWTTSEMIVWGGTSESSEGTNAGGRYDPANDSWVATAPENAPLARAGQTAVWTGSDMIIWGGSSPTLDQNTGGRYDPGTDSWAPTTTANAPSPRRSQTAVWTGHEMIIWGGLNFDVGKFLNTGGKYCAQTQVEPTPTPFTPTPSPSPSPILSPTPSPTRSPSATPTTTATATSTPTPSSTPSPTATQTPAPVGQALNISTRMRVDTGNNVLIGGFLITGTTPMNVAIRGIGPSLGVLGLPDTLSDPTLELRNSSGALLFLNDNWQDDPTQAAQLAALGLDLQNPNESGIITSLTPGAYTAILSGKDGGTGVGLVEVYDTSHAAGSQLSNISTRGFVLTGNNVMIGGFILGGKNNTHVVVRGIGPSLAQVGISNSLADPTLELHDSNGALLVSNDNWQDDSMSAAQLTALGLALQSSLESGIYVSLPPGAFTAILAGQNVDIGIGLVEVYNVH